jgi:hypothetical protein
MGDSNVNDDDGLVDYNEVDPDDPIAEKTQGTLNKGDETSVDK